MPVAPNVAFVVYRDGYRAIVDKLIKDRNPLSVADIAKKQRSIGKVSQVRTSTRATFAGMSIFLEVSVILFSMMFSLAWVLLDTRTKEGTTKTRLCVCVFYFRVPYCVRVSCSRAATDTARSCPTGTWSRSWPIRIEIDPNHVVLRGYL